MINQVLPVPDFFDESKVQEVWQVPYAQRTIDARNWVKQHKDLFSPVALDSPRICIVAIDIQNTFCIPTGELFVQGAIEDNIRFCKYIYKNMNNITNIVCSLDSHRTIAIFHEIFWISDNGDHPTPGVTVISAEDVKQGKWRVNPSMGRIFGDYMTLQRYALDYLETLEKTGKFSLLIWPFHGMIGGIGHALVASVEEAVFFHSIARETLTDYQIKGGNPLTEEYGLGGAEVRNSINKAQKNTEFLKLLLDFDKVIIAGEASSHCVRVSIENLLEDIMAQDPALAKKAYILRDCSSPVIIPGIVDFTAQAEEAFEKFNKAGMNIITTQTPIYELV